MIGFPSVFPLVDTANFFLFWVALHFSSVWSFISAGERKKTKKLDFPRDTISEKIELHFIGAWRACPSLFSCLFARETRESRLFGDGMLRFVCVCLVRADYSTLDSFVSWKFHYLKSKDWILWSFSFLKTPSYRSESDTKDNLRKLDFWHICWCFSEWQCGHVESVYHLYFVVVFMDSLPVW